MTAKEKLVEELVDKLKALEDNKSIHVPLHKIARFILNDRKRIVKEAVQWQEWDKQGCFGNDYNNHLEGAKKALRLTIKNALGEE